VMRLFILVVIAIIWIVINVMIVRRSDTNNGFINKENYMSIAIRNYQGSIPKGIWYCSSCKFETRDSNEAASHINKQGGWIYLIPDDVHDRTFEMHISDVNGVYLNMYNENLTYNDIRKIRGNFKHTQI
jgi:hypothetical protein